MSTAEPAADKVVICVFDGLRRDFVTPERMPNLARFAGQGTWFREARSVFPSMTRVATTAIAPRATISTAMSVDNANAVSTVACPESPTSRRRTLRIIGCSAPAR